MNGLAASRRSRGLPGMALNIGVIYGLGFLHREKDELYAGLEREGYPPISERDVHHMFLEAIVAGRPPKPPTTKQRPASSSSQITDITTGLNRFRFDGPNPLHWHLDPRFSHFTVPSSAADDEADASGVQKQSVKELLSQAETAEAAGEVLLEAFSAHLEGLLQLPPGAAHGENSISELGVDSLVAVDIRSWFWRSTETDVAVMKILAAPSIRKRMFFTSSSFFVLTFSNSYVFDIVTSDIADSLFASRRAAAATPPSVAETAAVEETLPVATPQPALPPIDTAAAAAGAKFTGSDSPASRSSGGGGASTTATASTSGTEGGGVADLSPSSTEGGKGYFGGK